MASWSRHLFTLVLALTLFASRTSFAQDAKNSASATISVTASITSGITIDTGYDEDGNELISWSYFGGNPEEFAKQVLVTVREGPSWNYTEYTFMLSEPYHQYHAKTFLPENILHDVDPHKEGALVALLQVNEVMDPNYFVQTQEALAAVEATSTGSEKPWQQPGTLIRSFI